eukprot:30595-Pelagococcus_subviridis.AAC.1
MSLELRANLLEFDASHLRRASLQLEFRGVEAQDLLLELADFELQERLHAPKRAQPLLILGYRHVQVADLLLGAELRKRALRERENLVQNSPQHQLRAQQVLQQVLLFLETVALVHGPHAALLRVHVHVPVVLLHVAVQVVQKTFAEEALHRRRRRRLRGRRVRGDGRIQRPPHADGQAQLALRLVRAEFVLFVDALLLLPRGLPRRVRSLGAGAGVVHHGLRVILPGRVHDAKDRRPVGHHVRDRRHGRRGDVIQHALPREPPVAGEVPQVVEIDPAELSKPHAEIVQTNRRPRVVLRVLRDGARRGPSHGRVRGHRVDPLRGP